MRNFFLLLFVMLSGVEASFCQVKHGDTLKFKDVYDSVYGINIYDKLNMNIGGDSVRNAAKGYASQGWVEDYYPNKQVLHKGYYIDGQLKAYKNFFPNGQVEREFKMTDLSKSTMTIYYQNGKMRSNIVYAEGNAIKEEDYFPNGQLEYVEENDKKAGCYIQRKFYNANGKPTSLLEITDKKRKVYSSKEYYENGNIKEEGEVVYSEGLGDYQKNGKWKFYDENGNIKEQKTFSKGEEGQ
ncbi:MAG: toxin-antitoxin system YwqK family antitoxin [Bacteroidia bacterium]